MKKLFVLAVIFILQLVFVSSFSCEYKVAEHLGFFTSKISKSYTKELNSSQKVSQKNNAEKHTTGSAQDHCGLCDYCSHVAISSSRNDFKVVLNVFHSINSNYNYIYNQPFISFSSKPPIRA